MNSNLYSISKTSWADWDDDDEELSSYTPSVQSIDLKKEMLSPTPSPTPSPCVDDTWERSDTPLEVQLDYRAVVSPSNAFHIRDDLKPVDVQGPLKLYKEEHLSRSSPDSLKAIRGVITDGTTLLVKAFPYTSQVCREDEDYEEVIRANVLPESDIYYTFDGSMVRVWFYENEGSWKVSTVSKIDAFKAKWNTSCSLGDKFVELQEYQTKMSFFDLCSHHLEKHKVYVFLMTTDPNTRYICYNEQPRVYALGSFDRSEQFRYVRCSMAEIGLPNPPSPNIFELKNIKTDGHIGITRTLENPKHKLVQEYKIEGYTVINPHTGTLTKICSMKYKKALQLRGKDPCKYIGYFYHYRKETEKDYVQLYSNLTKQFQILDEELTCMVQKVLKLYNRYDKEDPNRYSKMVRRIVKSIYNLYENEKNNPKLYKITIEDVHQYLHDICSLRDVKSYNFKIDLFSFLNVYISKKHGFELRMLENSMKPTKPLESTTPKSIIRFGRTKYILNLETEKLEISEVK